MASPSWRGAVRHADADAKPGHYYVTARNGPGKTVPLLGPFTQRKPGKTAHAQALGLVATGRDLAMRLANGHGHATWATYGTTRIDLCGSPPAGVFNEHVPALAHRGTDA